MSNEAVPPIDEPLGRSVLNLMGVRPGREAFQYEQLAMPSVIHFDVQFESTYEAIEELVLPSPLKADRREPPIVNISYFTNAEVYAMDGRNTPTRQSC